MTHTHHRVGSKENLRQDYVVLAMSAKDFNEKGSGVRLRRAFELFRMHNPVNMSDMKARLYYEGGKNYDRIRDRIGDTSIVHAVYTSLVDVEGLLRDLKEEDLGISVVVTGLFEEVFSACKRAEITPHTVNISLGTFGRKDLLPGDDDLEVITMCGHGMIGRNLVAKALQNVQSGEKASSEVAEDLGKICVCGVFNPSKAAAVIERRCGRCG